MISGGLMLTAMTLTGQDTAVTKYVFLDPYYFHLTYLKEDPALIAVTCGCHSNTGVKSSGMP